MKGIDNPSQLIASSPAPAIRLLVTSGFANGLDRLGVVIPDKEEVAGTLLFSIHQTVELVDTRSAEGTGSGLSRLIGTMTRTSLWGHVGR